MISSPTSPCTGWRKASGTVASTENPSVPHRATAGALHSTTALNWHRPVSVGPGLLEHVLAQGASDALSRVARVDHEPRGGDVRSRAAVVRTHLGRAQHRAVIRDGDERPPRGRVHPLTARGRLVRVRVPRERLTRADDLPHERHITGQSSPVASRIRIFTCVRRR
jgi:hypothetical protein